MKSSSDPSVGTSTDPRILNAVVAAFEALQKAGIFLHAADGHALSRDGFFSAMDIALTAAQSAPDPSVGTPQLRYRKKPALP